MASFAFHRATPQGEGAIALFELYGGGALEALRAAFRPRSGSLPGPGEARLGDLVAGGQLIEEPIDEAIVSLVPAEGMWCRLEAWTIAVHAGPWVQERVGALLASLGGERLEARDVLLRALEAGALDAVRTAAFELLLEARTEKAARFFARQHTGELSARLREGLALAEAGRLEEGRRAAADLLAGSRQALRLGRPLRVLIAGRPNAGKSTLFNRLAEGERAAVTPIPGTTRDVLEETIAIDDYPVSVADSAGLRPVEAASEVEREGIRRVLRHACDAVVYLIPHPWRRAGEDEAFLSGLAPERLLLAASLADLPGGEPAPWAQLRLSSLTGAGVGELREAIVRRWIDDRTPRERDVPAAAFTPRQREILERASATAGLDALRSAYIECLRSSWPPVDLP